MKMSKNVIINSVSSEALDYLEERYSVARENLEALIGKKANLNDEVIALLEEAKTYGAIEFEIEDEKENENDITDDAEEVKKLDDEEKTEELDDDEINETSEEEKTPERKEYEARYLKTRAMMMLEKIDAYRDLPADIQYQVMSAYDKVVDVGDIWDEDFLSRYLHIEEGRFLGNVSQIHMMVRGGLKMEEHIRGNQEQAEVQLEQSEIDSQSANEANNLTVRFPKVIADMDPYIQKDAEIELAEKLRKYIELATTNRTPEQSLLIISDMQKYAEEVKQDYANSIDIGEEKEATKNYIAQMPVTEMAAVMTAMKDATGDVKIRFDDINWNNEVDRKVAINMISQTQNATHEFGKIDPVVDKIEIKFDVDSWQDIQAMTSACRDLKGIDTEVSAKVVLPATLDENERKDLEVAAEQVLDKNGIEVEGQAPNTLEEVTEELDPITQMGINEVAAGATELPEKMAELMDELGNVIQDIGELGIPGGTTN